jgi:hypothetical protein
MDCEKVRDRFSSFWEKELSPSEEKVFKEHLSSCPKCQKEFERFGKTMRWLHSAGEFEVPEEFLPELYKKLEEKKRAMPCQKVGGRWFNFPLSFKLPAGAVAMVAVVFLVLYLTKMIPTEGGRLKETEQTPSSLSVQDKPEEVLTRPAAPSPISEGTVAKDRPGSTPSEPSPSVRQAHRPEQSPGTERGVEGLAQEEVKEERSALETPTETPRPKHVEKAKALALKEGRSEEAPMSQIKAEAKKSEAPARSPGVVEYQAVDSKEAARGRVTFPEPGKIERELASQEKSLMASKPPQEIILRISDRKTVIPRLYELVKQFGGEVVTTQGDMFLASLPTGSFSEFEKELAGISSSPKTDLLVAKKQATGSLSLEEGVKRKVGDEKSKEPAKLAADTKSRTLVRILLVEE